MSRLGDLFHEVPTWAWWIAGGGAVLVFLLKTRQDSTAQVQPATTYGPLSQGLPNSISLVLTPDAAQALASQANAAMTPAPVSSPLVPAPPPLGALPAGYPVTSTSATTQQLAAANAASGGQAPVTDAQANAPFFASGGVPETQNYWTALFNAEMPSTGNPAVTISGNPTQAASEILPGTGAFQNSFTEQQQQQSIANTGMTASQLQNLTPQQIQQAFGPPVQLNLPPGPLPTAQQQGLLP